MLLRKTKQGETIDLEKYGNTGHKKYILRILEKKLADLRDKHVWEISFSYDYDNREEEISINSIVKIQEAKHITKALRTYIKRLKEIL